MFKILSVLACGFLVMTANFANAKTLKELEQATMVMKVQNNQFSESLVPFKKQIESLDKKSSALQKELDRANSDYAKSYATNFGNGSMTGNVELKKKIDDLSVQLAATKKTEGELAGNAGTLNRGKIDLMSQAAVDGLDLKVQNKAVITALGTQGLLADFATLQKKVGDTDLALEKAAGMYDKSVLGAYLKDKLGLLLNSQVICEANARCRVPERKEVYPSITGRADPETGCFRESDERE